MLTCIERYGLDGYANYSPEIGPPGLGPKPLQRMLLLYYRMYTSRGTLGNIVVVLISVAGILSSFVRYQFLSVVDTSQMGAAVYTTVWVTVLFSSCTCSLLYFRLLLSCTNIPGLWMHSMNHLRVPGLWLFVAFVVNSAAGAYAVNMLRTDMELIAERVEAMEMHILWRRIFYVLYYSRLLQRVLECESSDTRIRTLIAYPASSLLFGV